MNIIQKIEERVMDLQAKGIIPEIVYLTRPDFKELSDYIYQNSFCEFILEDIGTPHDGYLIMFRDTNLLIKELNVAHNNCQAVVNLSRLEVPVKRLQGTLELISPGSVHLLHEDIDITGIV